MAISASDMVFRHSIKTGSAGDTTSGAPSTSLGKYVSTTVVSAGANGLFDDISGAENAASTVDYRCVFLLNNHATLTASNVKVYIASEVGGGASVAIALDNVAISAKGSSSAQADQIANETTAPSAVGSFSTSAVDDASGLSIGSLAPGQVKAIWIRRTAANTGPVSGDGFSLGLSFDTPA